MLLSFHLALPLQLLLVVAERVVFGHLEWQLAVDLLLFLELD
jgi:hypothetical protein